MKKLLAFIVFALSFTSLNAQTNVSGGIFTNTTWTLAGSPYIVIDTVVVFPGVTLTIEPGVVVKFDNNLLLEIREGSLIAEGTITDSITFTSNNINPVPGIWRRVMLTNTTLSSKIIRIKYCNFYYANVGINTLLGQNDSLFISRSNFYQNFYGISAYNQLGLNNDGKSFIDSCTIKNNLNCGVYQLSHFTMNDCSIINNGISFGDGGIMSVSDFKIQNCLIDSNFRGIQFTSYFSEVINCNVKNNGTGIVIGDGFIKNCTIDSNGVGVDFITLGGYLINSDLRYNTDMAVKIYWLSSPTNVNVYITGCIIEYNFVGIEATNTPNAIDCNKICNNTSYDFKYLRPSGTNINVSNNYWCSTDSATISSHIYDGYDNVSYGLVDFTPFDTIGCYFGTSIQVIEPGDLSFVLYPNPTSSSFTIKNTSTFQSENFISFLQIVNTLGEIVYEEKLTGNKERVINPGLTAGFYFAQVSNKNGNRVVKLVIQ